MADITHSFAVATLQGLGIIPNHQNVKALVGWAHAEGGHTHNDARWNFLNTTEPMPGAGNTGAQGNIKVYRNFNQGVQATVRTLKNGRYGPILRALTHGTAHDVAAAIDASPWGTHGALVYQAIGGASGAGPTGPGRRGTGSQRPASPSSSGASAPAVDQGARASLIANYLQTEHQPGALTTLAVGLNTPTASSPSSSKSPSTPKRVSMPSTPGSGAAPTGHGIATFDGKQVAAWMVPALTYARAHGWHGSIISGVRTRATQAGLYARYKNSGFNHAYIAAKPGQSNHEIENGGAVDVSDPQTLNNVLKGFRGRKPIWGGPVIGDYPHFSSNGH